MMTRRETLRTFASGGAAAFAAALPGTRALAATPPVRREISGLALNDPTVQTLRDGVRLLKARRAGQGPNWTDLANIHGTAAGFNRCPHGNWYFLPWHRAYLLMYERMIRAVTGNAGFAMPFWDWSAHRAVPPAFASPTINNQPNPLYVATRANTYSVPDIYTGPAVMNAIYGQTNFELFGSSRPAGQNSLNPSWIKGPGTQGTLEATPHNNIHVRLGGFMPGGNSPIDPIFLMHHGNIDHIWWSWNCRGRANSTDPLWLTMPFTNHYYNPNGTMATYRPADLLNIATLGYGYGLCVARVPSPPLRALADARLAQIFGAGNAVAARPAGAHVMLLQNRASGVGVEASGAAPPASLRTSLTTPPSTRPLAPAERISQVVALIHDLMPPDDRVEVLVFAGTGRLPPTADPRDPSFVTSIGFFGAHAHGHGGLSASVDLTEHLRKAPVLADQVHVRLVARPVGEANAAVAATVAHARVEVAIV